MSDRIDGPKEVLAKDIIRGPQVEILNPEHRIASLSKEGRLNATMVVRMGQGYVPAERNREEELPVDTIFMDAVFSPIRKVNFTVTNARVGQRTDYDRLVLEVWTDGSEKPEEALAHAAGILQDQVAIFINFARGRSPRRTRPRPTPRCSTRTCSAPSRTWNSPSGRRTVCRTPI